MAGSTSKTASAAKKTTSAQTSGSEANAASSSDAPKKKRTTLTSEQKIAKLEQDLADAKRKDQEKRDKQRNDLVEKRDKAQEKIDKLRVEVSEMQAEIDRLGPDGEPLVHPAGLNEDGSVKAASTGGHVDEDLNSDDAGTDADEDHEV